MSNLRKYDLLYGAYFLLSEAGGQVLLKEVYTELQGEKGAYPIMALCGAGTYLLSLHLAKTLYNIPHSPSESSDVDYAPSFRDQFRYALAEKQAARIAADYPEQASQLRSRASRELNEADQYSFSLRAGLVLGYAAKATLGTALGRKQGMPPLRALAYGLAVPAGGIYEDSRER